METAEECRQKAAQCRRLAKAIMTPEDPSAAELLKLAAEWEAKAIAAEKIAAEKRPSKPASGPA